MKKVLLLRTKPYAVLCYEALFRSLIPKLRETKILHDDFASYLAGYRGEKNVDYVVSSYPHKEAYIFQGIRLKVGPFSFQIDTLILTPMLILILETKNLKGVLEYYPTTQQLIQIDGDQKKSQRNPILQAETQKRHLILWLQQFGFPPIPIETLGISANSSSILTYKEEISTLNRFIQLEYLPTMLDTFYQKYTKRLFDPSTIKKAIKRLLKENTPLKPDLFQQYNINTRHLINGISCLECDYSPLNYKNLKWGCRNCGFESSKLHEQKILDYFLLHKQTITNKECREILQINSAKIARRILYSMNLEYSGRNSSRKYHAPSLEKYNQDSFIPISKRSIFN